MCFSSHKNIIYLNKLTLCEVKKYFVFAAIASVAISCGGPKTEQSKGHKGDKIEDRLEAAEAPATFIRENPEPAPERPIIPSPETCWENFEIEEEGQAIITQLNQSSWAEITLLNYVDESRYGSLPMNLASGERHAFVREKLVYDSIYYYATEMEYGSNKLHKVNKYTGEESMIELPVKSRVNFLNLWKNKLYYISNYSIRHYHLESAEIGFVATETYYPSMISIVDNRLFYASFRDGIWVHDLESGEHKQIVADEVNWFWVSENLLIYTDNQDKAYIVDFSNRKRYSTPAIFLRGTYFQDRLLFSPFPEIWDHFDEDFSYQYNKDRDDNNRHPYVIRFGQDSLVVLPHREQFMGLLKGKFIGLPPDVSDYEKCEISVYTPPFRDNLKGFYSTPVERKTPGETINLCVNMFFSGNRLISYETYSFFPLIYFDAISGESHLITDEQDFKSNDPRAVPKENKHFGDTLITGIGKNGSVRVEINPKRSADMKISVTGGGYNEVIDHWQRPFWLKGFFNNKVLFGSYGDEGVLGSFYYYYLHCIDTGNSISFKVNGNNVDIFRDGFLFQAHRNEVRIGSFEPNW